MGDTIEKGHPVVILSAMKMETVVQSPVAGKVKEVKIEMGQKIEAEDLLLVVE